jgi:hypothetical protein
VDSDCSGLYDGWWVCIAVQPQSVTVSFEYAVTEGPVELPSTTVHTPTVFPTADSNFDPSPTQPGIASNCKAFQQAKDVSFPVYHTYSMACANTRAPPGRNVQAATPLWVVFPGTVLLLEPRIEWKLRRIVVELLLLRGRRRLSTRTCNSHNTTKSDFPRPNQYLYFVVRCWRGGDM